MTAVPHSQPMTELDEWKQAASVEAGLRREFYDRALTAEAALQEAYAGHRRQKARIQALEIALREIDTIAVSKKFGAARDMQLRARAALEAKS